MFTNTLVELAQLMAMRQLELEAKGITPMLARAAVNRAWGSAQHRVKGIRPELIDMALHDVFLDELRKAEEWTRQERGQLAS